MLISIANLAKHEKESKYKFLQNGLSHNFITLHILDLKLK